MSSHTSKLTRLIQVTFLLFTVVFSATAAPRTTIIGQVVDEESGLGLPYANILLYKTDTTEQINGTATDEEGAFVIFNTGYGTFDLKIKALGYAEWTVKAINITEVSPKADLELIALRAETMELESVTYTSEAVEMVLAPDRKVFRVDKNAANAGSSAIEVLENIPSVDVDIEGNITLRGSESVKVMIDGKKSSRYGSDPQTALQQLPADMIERIEVITNPSAKFDAEGVAGMLNIVLKKERRSGANGSVNGHINTPLGYGGSANLNYRVGKANFFINEGFRSGERPMEIDIFQRYYTANPYSILRQEGERSRDYFGNNFRTGFEYAFTPRTTLTTSVFHTYRTNDNEASLDYRYYDESDDLLSHIRREDPEDENSQYYGSSINFAHDFNTKGHSFNADFEIELGEDEEESVVKETILWDAANANRPVQRQNVTNNEDEINLQFNADYVYPFSKDGKFETGVKATMRTLNNDFYVKQENQTGDLTTLDHISNEMDFAENIFAAYATFANRYRKFSYQLGLRTEYSDVSTEMKLSDDTYDRDYVDFFPSIHLNYHLTPINSIAASYSRRLDRPRYWHMLPFYSYTDSRNIRRGNPNLDPEYTDSYEIGHIAMWESGSLSSTAYYRYTDGLIERMQTKQDSVIYSQPFNIGNRDAFGVEFVASQAIAKWWSLQGNFNFFRAVTEGNLEGISLNSDTYMWFARLSSRFTIFDAYNLQLRFRYRGPSDTIQGKRKAGYMMDGGISRQFMKGNLAVSLNVRDLLNSRRRSHETFADSFYSKDEMRFSSQMISLSLTYKFNQDRQRRKPKRPNTGTMNSDDSDEIF